MFDEFFIRPLLAGFGLALIAGPLGCLVVWRRMAYFGDTLAHAALLGVALGFFLQINLMLSVFVISVLIALCLLILQKSGQHGADSLLGLLSHSALAIGLVAFSLMPGSAQTDLTVLLMGDILSVSSTDLIVIWAGGALALLVLWLLWRPLFAATVSVELAEAEGMKPDRLNIVFMLMMALVIAIAINIVGVLMIAAMLIIPATTARRFASGPEVMAALAILIGMGAVLSGLFISFQWDSPAGPSIIVAAFLIFIASLVLGGLVLKKAR